MAYEDMKCKYPRVIQSELLVSVLGFAFTAQMAHRAVKHVYGPVMGFLHKHGLSHDTDIYLEGMLPKATLAFAVLLYLVGWARMRRGKGQEMGVLVLTACVVVWGIGVGIAMHVAGVSLRIFTILWIFGVLAGIVGWRCVIAAFPLLRHDMFKEVVPPVCLKWGLRLKQIRATPSGTYVLVFMGLISLASLLLIMGMNRCAGSMTNWAFVFLVSGVGLEVGELRRRLVERRGYSRSG